MFARFWRFWRKSRQGNRQPGDHPDDSSNNFGNVRSPSGFWHASRKWVRLHGQAGAFPLRPTAGVSVMQFNRERSSGISYQLDISRGPS
jgi:hypothetical protein